MYGTKRQLVPKSIESRNPPSPLKKKINKKQFQDNQVYIYFFYWKIFHGFWIKNNHQPDL